MMRRTIHLFGGAILAALMTTAAGAGDYYVAPDGDDANSGTVDKPLKSPTKVAPTLQPGDSLIFRAGEYKCATDGTLGIGPVRSGKEGKPITFKTHNNEHVKIDCAGSDWGFSPNGWSWIVIDGFEIVNKSGYGMKISANHGNGKQTGNHVTVRNCEIHHSANECLFSFKTPWLTIENCHMHDSARSHGIYINQGCHNVVIRNVTSENNQGNSGTQINASGGGTKDGLIERCLLRGNAQGYSLMGAIHCTFRNNVVINNGFDGPRESGRREVIMWNGDELGGKGTACEGNVFENNTFVNLVPQGHKIEQLVVTKPGTKDCTFRNNIFVVRGKNIFNLGAFDGFTFENNCLFNIDGGQQVAAAGGLVEFCKKNNLKESGTVEKDPLFVDLDKGDLRLKDSSPCIDAGAKTDSKDKVEGKARDIGALEKGAEAQIGCKLPWKKPEAAR